jgi:hypothetical protein
MRRIRRAGLALLAAWVVVLVTYLLGVAWLVPPLIVVATAALLRGGRTLLDRLMLAVALLIGPVCLGGVLFSFWPWHLHPVAVGGLAVTGLVVAYLVTGREPVLPRPRLGDGVTVAGALGVGAIAAWPIVTGDQVQRVSFLTAGEDLDRHLSIFDGIRQIGGYLYLHPNAADTHVYHGLVTYPQGSHFLYALLDGFVRSSAADQGSGMSALDHFLGFAAYGYGFLVLTMLWAAQWIAAAALNLTRRILLVGIVAAFTLDSDIFRLLVLGYTSEVMGLTLAVLAIALLVRPLARTGELLLIIGSLVVALGFSYYLYLPALVLAVAIWLVRHRQRAQRHRLGVALLAVAVVVAAAPAAMGYFVGGQSSALLVASGPPGRDVLIGVVCVIAAGLLAPGAMRTATWRGYAYSAGAVVVAVGALYAVQRATDTQHVAGYYYTNKTLDLLLCVLCVGVGSLLLYLPAPDRRPVRPALALRRAVPAGLLVVALAAVVGIPFGDTPVATTPKSEHGNGFPRYWALGGFSNRPVAAIVAAQANTPTAPGVVTIVSGSDPLGTYVAQLGIATLQRTSGVLGPGMYQGLALDDPMRIEKMVLLTPGTIDLVVFTDDAERQARDIAARHPERQITVSRATVGWGGL